MGLGGEKLNSGVAGSYERHSSADERRNSLNEWPLRSKRDGGNKKQRKLQAQQGGHRHMASSKHFGAGFSLVEVLVSIVVLSVGCSAPCACCWLRHAPAARPRRSRRRQPGSRTVGEGAHEQGRGGGQRCGQCVPDRAMMAGTGAGSEAGAGGMCVASGASCNAAQLAAWDMREWKQRIAGAARRARQRVLRRGALERAAGEYAWACSHTGRSVVVKLGWTPCGAETTARVPRAASGDATGARAGGRWPVGS
jgi:type IV pilus assembly protein PilV